MSGGALSRRVSMLRAGYLLAAFGALTMAALTGSGAITNAMIAAAHAPPHMKPVLLPGLIPEVTVGFVLFATLFVFLAFRPYWWGKLLCVWAGLSWTGFGAGSLVLLHNNLVGGAALAGGGAVLLAALIHQIADPRFSGPYLRSA
jgi:hypothetical protein